MVELSTARAVSMSLGVLIGWFTDGVSEPILVTYFEQFTHRRDKSGHVMIGDSDNISRTRLWSEDNYFKFIISYVSLGRLTSAMSRTFGLWSAIAG